MLPPSFIPCHRFCHWPYYYSRITPKPYRNITFTFQFCYFIVLYLQRCPHSQSSTDEKVQSPGFPSAVLHFFPVCPMTSVQLLSLLYNICFSNIFSIWYLFYITSALLSPYLLCYLRYTILLTVIILRYVADVILMPVRLRTGVDDLTVADVRYPPCPP